MGNRRNYEAIKYTEDELKNLSKIKVKDTFYDRTEKVLWNYI